LHFQAEGDVMFNPYTVAIAVSFALMVVLGVPRVSYHAATGSWFPIRKVDKLCSPVAITGWVEEGLRLADGRIVQLPGFRKLPLKSGALAEVASRGVEIGSDGKAYGLIKVHHGCNRDPVREHIARVDIADLLMYLGEGELTTPLSGNALEYAASEPGAFSRWGFSLVDFSRFQSWQTLKDLPAD
jgi:hypothetical protein